MTLPRCRRGCLSSLLSTRRADTFSGGISITNGHDRTQAGSTVSTASRGDFFCGCESVIIRKVKSSLFVISSQWRTSHLVNTNISGINFHCYNHCALPSCLRTRINLFSSARAKTERESPSFFSFRKNIRC